MILEDFVMLGKTIPEANADGRVFVCSAGMSNDLRSLVRLYPLSRWQAPARWSISSVPVERNPRDSRRESFCLKGNRSPAQHAAINILFQGSGTVAREHRDALVDPYRVSSIREANERRLSLAIIEPDGVARLHFDTSENSPNSPQLSLFAKDPSEERELGSRRFAYQPRLEFRDADGWHDLQLRDWGGYEFMRRHGDDRRHELAAAARLDAQPLLLVGNQNNARTAWLVISVLFPIRQRQLDL